VKSQKNEEEDLKINLDMKKNSNLSNVGDENENNNADFGINKE